MNERESMSLLATKLQECGILVSFDQYNRWMHLRFPHDGPQITVEGAAAHRCDRRLLVTVHPSPEPGRMLGAGDSAGNQVDYDGPRGPGDVSPDLLQDLDSLLNLLVEHGIEVTDTAQNGSATTLLFPSGHKVRVSALSLCIPEPAVLVVEVLEVGHDVEHVPKYDADAAAEWISDRLRKEGTAVAVSDIRRVLALEDDYLSYLLEPREKGEE